jgi:adenine deaminase
MAAKEPSQSNQSSGAPRRSTPDIVLLNAKVFTTDLACRYAEAVAIAGERILAIGATNEIAAIADAHTRRFDLRGRVVIPGINDAHFHHTPDPRARPCCHSPAWNRAGTR